jgi:hypothetical protein
MEVRFHRLAAQEYRDARIRYEHRRAGLGSDFTAAVDRAVNRIATEPGRWPVFRERYHSVRVRRFPYRLYYHVLGLGFILILAVAHDHRRPGYWLRRSAT